MTDFVLTEGGPSKISVQGIREAKTAASTIVGTVKQLAFGKEVIYARLSTATETSVGGYSAGKVCYAPILVANHGRAAVAITASIGAKEVILSLGATSASQNEYEDGTLLVECGTGTGYSYMIAGHPAWAATNTAAKVILKDGLEVALNTASLCTLMKNRCVGVRPNNSAVVTGPATGVLLISAAAGSYVYLGKKGEWPAQVEGTWIVGNDLERGSAAGSVAPWLTAATTKCLLGKARMTASTDGFSICDFNL